MRTFLRTFNYFNVLFPTTFTSLHNTVPDRNFVSVESLSINSLLVCTSVELVDCIMANWKTAIGPFAESSRMARFHNTHNVVVSHKRKNIEVLAWSIGHDGVFNLYTCADY